MTMIGLLTMFVVMVVVVIMVMFVMVMIVVVTVMVILFRLNSTLNSGEAHQVMNKANI